MRILSKAFIAISLLLYTPVLWATSLDEVNRQVQQFIAGKQARFAPEAMKKITAYQGAAMLATEQESAFEHAEANPQLQAAITKIKEVLQEARNTAQIFQSEHADLLALERQADKAYAYHHAPRIMAQPDVEHWYQQGKQAMKTAIQASEQGQLNLAAQAGKKAEQAFLRCIDLALPGILEQSEYALDQAADAGAKRYAPRTWEKAKQAFTTLQTYLESKAEKKHPRPDIGLAMEWAVYAQKIAIHAKYLRRDYGSYEKLLLDARQTRLQYADALGITYDKSKVDADVDADVILQAIQQLQTENHQYKQQAKALHAKFEEDLAAALRQQREQDQKTFMERMRQIKSAYASRLEQETFERKRQNKLRELFRKGEVEVITNLDGSLIIRAKALHFEPNSSKVDSRYYDFLARIKQALMLYPDRHITIEGHTDSTGEAKANRKLSLARAKAVQNFLVASGLSGQRIKAVGYGEAKPIASNMYKKGRAMNRRIDIVIEAPHD